MLSRGLKGLHRLLIYCLLLLCIACSEDKTLQLKAGDSILAFGDSLTVGVGADERDSYPVVLGQLTGLEVISEGISGEKTAEGLARFEAVLNTHRPSAVILLEGGNDVLRKVPQPQIKRNLESMILTAQLQSIPVILVAVPEKNLLLTDMALYAELADLYDLVLVDGIVSDLLRSPDYKSDPIHFNTAGYQKLAEAIADVITVD